EGIHGPLHTRVLQQRLELRREPDSVLVDPVDQRLLPDPVASQHQALPLPIPEGQREHATQAAHEVEAFGFVEVDETFRVRARTKGMARSVELRAQLRVVVDLAVEHDGDGLVLVPDRLTPGVEVDDGEPAHAERESSFDEGALVVGPTVLDDLPPPAAKSPASCPPRP